MRIFIVSILVLISGLFIFNPVVSAVEPVPGCGSNLASTDVCKDVTSQAASNSSPILSTLKTVMELISYIIGITAIIVLIVAGLQFMIGGSDPQAVANARNTLIYALVGIVIAVLAQSIVVFVLKNVG
jgi:Type IV secretion system pilin